MLGEGPRTRLYILIVMYEKWRYTQLSFNHACTGLIGDALRSQIESSPKMCSALQTLCKHSDAAVKSKAQNVWEQLHDIASTDDCLQ